MVEYIQLCSQWQLVVGHKLLAIRQLRFRLVRQLELLQLARRTRQVVVIQQQVDGQLISQQPSILFFPRFFPKEQFRNTLFPKECTQHIFPKLPKEYIQ
jgi:hypothetical protein